VAGGAFATWPPKKNLLYDNLPFVLRGPVAQWIEQRFPNRRFDFLVQRPILEIGLEEFCRRR